MVNARTDEPTQQKPLRLWPGVIIVVLQWLVRFGSPIIEPGNKGEIFGAMGGLAGGLLIVVWWAFFSRARWSERLGAIFLMGVSLFAMWHVNHESMGPHWFVWYPVPVLSLAFVAWAVASRRLADGPRRATMVATILLACGMWTLLRTDGVTGDHAELLVWRWSETPEERLLAQAGDVPAVLPSAPVAAVAGDDRVTPDRVAPDRVTPEGVTPDRVAKDWPGFRGPDRDGIIRGVRIETDWSASPPVELWRRKVGPGWSSFAVRGDLVYTQEQRGDDEVVTCYNATTGEPVWRHHDAARFWESMGGAGPRGTPALSEGLSRPGRVYTFGATGILNALDAGDGSVVWSRDVASDADAKIPDWGFSSSPLVTGDVVIVHTAGKLVAYDLATGEPRWFGPLGGYGFSSPHQLTIDGVEQILMLDGAGATSVAPADGTLLWRHPWPSDSRIVQPALTASGDILIGSGFTSGIGMRRIAVAHGPDGWTTEERWTSNRLKPYFNDFVIHHGHAFGFDGRILACIDLEDGERKWKGGRYGHGQLVLLADQDLLLVLSEKGELALVGAVSDQFTELARLPAIEGKTWNHPVLVGDVLLVRNGQEMVAFRLPIAGAAPDDYVEASTR